MNGAVLALSGGVGGAKLVHGLSGVVAPMDLTVVVNTGDDFRHLGLAISPDIDSVVYALAGLEDPQRGWGRRDETWQFMQALREIGGDDWFQLGDLDLATHVERTRRLAAGESLSEATAACCSALGITARILPMSDDAVCTRLASDGRWLDFQDYFVRRRCEPVISAIEFVGVRTAQAHPEFLAALGRTDLRAIVLCPSNPFVSLDPILSLTGVREALRRTSVPVIGVTPIIGGRAIKGPAAKMLQELGYTVDAESIVRRYADFLDVFLVDHEDVLASPIDGVSVCPVPALMRSVDDRIALARAVLSAADTVRSGR